MPENPEPLIIDVRPLLAKGIEPFGQIIEAKSRLKPRQQLVLRAPFEPVPLYAIFQEEGYQVDAEQQAEDDWEIVFTPASGDSSREYVLDLRSMEPRIYLPKAMNHIQALGPDEHLLIHTSSEPVEVLEQIETETTDADCEEVGPNHWITTVWRIAR